MCSLSVWLCVRAFRVRIVVITHSHRDILQAKRKDDTTFMAVVYYVGWTGLRATPHHPLPRLINCLCLRAVCVFLCVIYRLRLCRNDGTCAKSMSARPLSFRVNIIEGHDNSIRKAVQPEVDRTHNTERRRVSFRYSLLQLLVGFVSAISGRSSNKSSSVIDSVRKCAIYSTPFSVRVFVCISCCDLVL